MVLATLLQRQAADGRGFSRPELLLKAPQFALRPQTPDPRHRPLQLSSSSFSSSATARHMVGQLRRTEGESRSGRSQLSKHRARSTGDASRRAGLQVRPSDRQSLSCSRWERNIRDDGQRHTLPRVKLNERRWQRRCLLMLEQRKET